MSTIFKRFAALLLVLTLAVSLAACNKNDEIDQAQKVMNTEAVSVGDHKISAAMLNYFYMDAVSEWYATYGSSLGLDISKPLNEQVLNNETGKTWADAFLEMALENIQSTYALYDLAMAENFTLSEADQAALDVTVEELDGLIEYYSELYSSMGQTYPYTSATDYLQTVYGLGATSENYMEYCRVCTIASAYYTEYSNSLTYTGQQLREYEKDKYARYCSYSFTTYYLSVSDFESAEAAEAAAQQLASGSYADKAAFDEAIKALAINAGKEDVALSDSYTDILYGQITTDYIDWLADTARMPGDMGMIAKEATAGDTTTVKGYYVVRFDGITDNQFFMTNIRHVLIAFEGGTTNSITGETTYSDKEKAAAQFEAEKLLLEYRTGSMTELRFADIANNHSDDSDGTDGGLYENLYPGILPSAVEQWCFDPSRNPGDTSLVASEYGWHLMYFVGNAEMTFRDYMLSNDMRIEDISAWYDALLENTAIELLDDTYVNKALVLDR